MTISNRLKFIGLQMHFCTLKKVLITYRRNYKIRSIGKGNFPFLSLVYTGLNYYSIIIISVHSVHKTEKSINFLFALPSSEKRMEALTSIKPILSIGLIFVFKHLAHFWSFRPKNRSNRSFYMSVNLKMYTSIFHSSSSTVSAKRAAEIVTNGYLKINKVLLVSDVKLITFSFIHFRPI